jgi:ABC-type branched-subunit amino acid transport system ATPase component
MPSFKCVKPTTFRGRQVIAGAGVMVNDTVAKTLEKHPCWVENKTAKPVKSTALAAAEKAAAKEAKEADIATAAAKKEQDEADAAALEVERQKLLEQARALDLKPNAHTGVPKLKELIEAATAKTAQVKDTGSVV